MQFNASDSYDDLISEISFQTRADLVEYPIEDRTRNLNHWYFRTIKDIMEVVGPNVFFDTSLSAVTDNGWTLNLADGSAVHDLVSGTREIALPTTNKPWIIYRVAYMRDGVTYQTAVPFHVGQLKGNVNLDIIDSRFTADAPSYRYNGNSIIPLPSPNLNVTGGLKIWYIPEPAKFRTTDTTKLPEINATFHRILSLGTSYDFLSSRGKTALPIGRKAGVNPIKGDIEQLREELRNFYSRFLDDAQPDANQVNLPSYA